MLRYYRGIGFKIHGNPVGMGTRLAVLPRLWGWTVNCRSCRTNRLHVFGAGQQSGC